MDMTAVLTSGWYYRIAHELLACAGTVWVSFMCSVEMRHSGRELGLRRSCVGVECLCSQEMCGATIGTIFNCNHLDFNHVPDYSNMLRERETNATKVVGPHNAAAIGAK